MTCIEFWFQTHRNLNRLLIPSNVSGRYVIFSAIIFHLESRKCIDLLPSGNCSEIFKVFWLTIQNCRKKKLLKLNNYKFSSGKPLTPIVILKITDNFLRKVINFKDYFFMFLLKSVKSFTRYDNCK